MKIPSTKDLGVRCQDWKGVRCQVSGVSNYERNFWSLNIEMMESPQKRFFGQSDVQPET
ncbi:MAG: hypothetical protein IMF02_03380 [Proteobacteria bacterium]|nr:hypothetical protein [Pseudomonadota bacterium]